MQIVPYEKPPRKGRFFFVLLWQKALCWLHVILSSRFAMEGAMHEVVSLAAHRLKIQADRTQRAAEIQHAIVMFGQVFGGQMKMFVEMAAAFQPLVPNAYAAYVIRDAVRSIAQPLAGGFGLKTGRMQQLLMDAITLQAEFVRLRMEEKTCLSA